MREALSQPQSPRAAAPPAAGGGDPSSVHRDECRPMPLPPLGGPRASPPRRPSLVVLAFCDHGMSLGARKPRRGLGTPSDRPSGVVRQPWGTFPTARLERRLPDRHPQAGGQRSAGSLPPIPKGVVADATSSSTTGHHAACTWCSYSSAAVSREAGARARPRWRARVRCASGVALSAGAKARADDQHRAVPARRTEARRGRAFERGGRTAVGPDGETRTALPRLPRVDVGPSLLGAKRRQGANHLGRLSGVHAVGGPPGQHARPLLPASRVRSRQDPRGRVGHGQLRRLTADR